MKLVSTKTMLAAIMATMLLLTACGNSNNQTNGTTTPSSANASPSAGGSPEPEKQENVELKVINFRVEDKAFFDEVNQAFEAKYPHIKIKYDAVPTKDWAAFKEARITTGDVDIMGSGGEADIYNPALRQQMADIGQHPFFDQFYPDALKAGQLDGKQYFLPMSSIALVTFYNKKIFADLGLSVPRTWDEFVSVSEKLKSGGIEPIMYGGKDQWPINMVIGALEAGIVRSQDPAFYDKMKTEETKFTDPAWVEVFEKLGVISKYMIKNSLGLDYGQAPGLFAQGKAAMMIDGSWSLSQIEDAKPDFEVGAFLLPGSNDKEANGIATTKFGFGWNIYSGSKNKEAAVTYLQFIMEPANYQKYMDMVRMLPVIDGTQVTSPVANEVSALLKKQMPIWELYRIPGAKYEFERIGVEIIMNRLTAAEAADQSQQALIGSKSNWQ